MLNAIGFGLAAGAAIQAWRAFPASAPVTGDSVAVVFIAGVVCAWLGGVWVGRGRRGGNATATATATATAVSAAEATNTVNLAVIVPGGGARPVGVQMPTSDAPWLSGVGDRQQLTADDIEGMDLSELYDVPESEEA